MPTLKTKPPRSKAPRDNRRLRKREDPPGVAEIVDLRHEVKFKRRRMLDMLRVENAAKAIRELPDMDTSIHIIMRGNFAFGDIIPATLKLIEPETLVYLAVTTLWFAKATIMGFTQLLDTGQVQSLDFICSHLYAHKNAEQAANTHSTLALRGSRFAAARCHSKIILMETTDGHYYVSEGSANIRACRATEQFALFQDRGLFDFHRQWIGDLIEQYTPPKEHHA